MKTDSKSQVISLWAPVLIWAAVIFTLSSLETVRVTQIFFWDVVTKKSAHIFEYALLFILVYRATNKKWFASFILCFLYAFSDEFHQSFIPGRTASIYDILFDLTGLNIAAYSIWKLTPRITWLTRIRPKGQRR